MTFLPQPVRRLLALTLLSFPVMVSAETASIHLLDGSTIRGEVVSLKGGNYKIQTPTLGELNIPQSNIRSVEYGATANSTQPVLTPDTSNAQLATITSQVQNTPALLGDIQALSNDPAIMAIVQDPEIQRLISNGDYIGLMKNPKMKELMNNSKIRDLTSKLK